MRDNLTAGGPIRLGTAMVAAWALGLEGHDESGGAIVVDDPLAEELRHLMAAQRAGHGTAFISHEGIFGGLATNERFRRTFVEELEALRRQGRGRVCAPWPAAPGQPSPGCRPRRRPALVIPGRRVDATAPERLAPRRNCESLLPVRRIA